MWPFTRKREAQSYTGTVSDAWAAHLTGQTQSADAIAALEVSAGLWARAFASARVEPSGIVRDALSPFVLAMIGRALIRRGEIVYMIDVDRAGGLRLRPAASFDVHGSAEPDSWTYRVELAGPDGTTSRALPAAGVVHIRYAVEPGRTWRGLSPLAYAYATGKLAGNLEGNLANEAGGATAYVLPVPTDGGESNLDGLRADVKAAKGSTALVETTTAGWGEGRSAAPQRDWQSVRIGANPPPVLATLRSDAAMSILAACGVPPSLSMPNSDGTAQREAWRRFLFSSVSPLARVVAAELADKLDTPALRLAFDDLYASDLTGRAGAFSSMVGAGMDADRAASLAGLDE